jgi:TolA-binding protein
MQQNFQTTGTLTGKVYKTLTPENVKLTGLGSQLSQMENDFEDMKRAREEAKRQLERKFEEVHK